MKNSKKNHIKNEKKNIYILKKYIYKRIYIKKKLAKKLY